MYISINKQFLSFQNVSPFHLSLARERLKRRFLISNDSTDSISCGTYCLQASCRLGGSAVCILCISYFSHM